MRDIDIGKAQYAQARANNKSSARGYALVLNLVL
jgi:hypothetical protein